MKTNYLVCLRGRTCECREYVFQMTKSELKRLIRKMENHMFEICMVEDLGPENS